MKAVEKSFLNASDLCSIEISKTKTFTLCEMLLKPCIHFIAKEALSLQEAQKLERIPLSNDIVQRSIEDMLDVEEQV